MFYATTLSQFLTSMRAIPSSLFSITALFAKRCRGLREFKGNQVRVTAYTRQSNSTHLLQCNAVVNCSCLWEEVSNSRAKHCGPVASVWPQRSRSVVEGQFSLSAIGLFLLPRSTMCHEICKLVWLRTKEPSMARIISCMQLVQYCADSGLR
jgi:hypothetical protein